MAMNMMIRNTLLKKMVKRHAPAVQPSDLLKGLPGLKGLEPNQALARLSHLLFPLGNDAIRICMNEDDETIRQYLMNSQTGRKLIDEFDKVMRTFGHLSSNTTNFTETPWVENPAMIWSAIGSGALILDRNLPDDAGEIHHARKEKVLQQLNAIRRPVFRQLLNSTIKFLTLRERISLLLSDDTYQFRRVALSIGKDLVRQEILRQPDDIFYLHFDELKQLITNKVKSKAVTDQIKKRREQIKSDTDLIPEDTICGEQTTIQHVAHVSHSEFLSGICGSSGFKKGYACVVQNPQSISKVLTSEDILVVPFTHVGWIPLFQKIGGIVAESGGQLSHTSIIAREYGIPALVNVKHAMRLIKNGQQIILDANNNRIYLQPSGPSKGDKS